MRNEFRAEGAPFIQHVLDGFAVDLLLFLFVPFVPSCCVFTPSYARSSTTDRSPRRNGTIDKAPA